MYNFLKYKFIFLFALTVTLCLAALFAMRLQKLEGYHTQETSPAQNHDEVTRPEYLINIFDHQYDQFVSISGQKNNDQSSTYTLELFSKKYPIIEAELDNQKVFFEFTLPASTRHQLHRLLHKNHIDRNLEGQIVAWSPTGELFAVHTEDHLVLFSSEVQTALRPNSSDSYHYRFITRKTEIPLTQIKGKLRDFSFSGDGNQILLNVESIPTTEDNPYHNIGAYSIDLNSPTPELVFIDYIEVYPISGQDGYAYFYQNLPDYSRLNLIVKSSQMNLSLPVPTADNTGKITFSPDLTKVCYERGTSGYWGYAVFDLRQQTEIVSGKQYSYCDRWLTNTTLLTIYIPYEYGIRSGEGYRYLLDLNTKQEEFIAPVSLPPINQK